MRADGPLVLGIESATAHVGCAIGGPGGVLASARSGRSRRHAESLAPQIEFVTAQAGVALRDIDVVAVDIGPGLYTGLRVGVTTAMTMAHMLGVPIVAISSLDVLAHALGPVPGHIHAVIDARRSELFHAAYVAGDGRLERVSEPRVVAPEVLRRELETLDVEVTVVGDAVLSHPDAFISLGGVRDAGPSFIHPSADVLVRLAREPADAERIVTPAEVRPMYLRRPDAVARWDAAPT